MKKISIILILIIFLIMGCVSGVSEKETAVVYYNLGNAYLELKQWDNASAAFLNAINLDGTLYKASYNLARTYIESGDVKKGIDVLEDLLPEDDDNSILLETLAWAYFLNGNNEMALSLYEKILLRTEYNKNALYNAGIILWTEGKSEKAYSYLIKLYEFSSDDSDLLYNLGLIELELEKSSGLEYFKACRVLSPERTDNLAALGKAYADEEYYALALDAFDKYLTFESTDSDILFRKAYILLTSIEDLTAGINTLSAAVSAGYKDKTGFKELSEFPDLLFHQEIMDYLVQNSLYDPDGASEEDISDESSDVSSDD